MTRAGVCAAATWLLVVQGASGIDALGQALPPPRDGDIRVLYYELPKETTVWLTLEPKSPEGKPLPMGMFFTLNLHFAGKQPKAPVEQVELRAHVGLLWAPRVEVWFLLDDRDRIDLTPKSFVGLISGDAWNYLPTNVPVTTLTQIAQAKRVTGNALGVEFELTESQVRAIHAFLDRVLSDNPAQFGK